VCRRHGVPVVDDAAQALGAEIDGRSPGTLGDVGVVSFGNGKVCFGSGGGVLVSADADLLARAAATPMRRPRGPGVLARAGSVLLWRRWRRRTLPLRVLLARLGLREAPAGPYERTAMANLDAAVARSLLRGLGANVAGRRRRVALYEERLADVPGLRLIPHRPGSACLTQVVSVRPRTAAAPAAADVVARLRELGFEVHRSYRPLSLLPARAISAPGGLAVTEDVWDTLIELPCEPSVPEHLIGEIAERVVDIVSRPC
jgi:pyridoxal phosphate-dependent aminotransferase EpsN